MERRAALVLALSLLFGCPQATPDLPPLDEGRAGGTPQAGASEGGGAPDVQQGAPSFAEGEVPTFADLLEEGKPTVKVEITVIGASEGFIEFHSELGDGESVQPEMVAREPFAAGRASLVVPAGLEGQLFVGAVAASDEPTDGPRLRGDAPAPLVIGTKDISLTIEMGKEQAPDAPEPPGVAPTPAAEPATEPAPE